MKNNKIGVVKHCFQGTGVDFFKMFFFTGLLILGFLVAAEGLGPLVKTLMSVVCMLVDRMNLPRVLVVVGISGCKNREVGFGTLVVGLG